jgi:hypothetical protein
LSEDSDLQDVEGGPTWEEALHKLLGEKDIALHTEITHPDAMSALDIAAEHWGQTISPGVGRLLKNRQHWDRKNMAAWKRKRASEVIDGIKGQVENEKKKKDLEEIMSGVQR